MSYSGGTPISYKPQVNRAITKRWAEAKQISYEGNDWGDEDDDYYEPTPASARGYPQSAWPAQNASAQRYGTLPPHQGITQSNRSFTNPSPTPNNDRPSFDRGDDRRNFSSHGPSSSFEGPYPSAQRNPFPEPQHDWQQQPYQESSTRAFHGPPPLQIQTPARPQSRDHPPPVLASSRDHAQHTQMPSTLDSRASPYQDPAGVTPYAPVNAGRRSQSSGRPSLSDVQGRSESPYRAMNPPISARSQHSRDQSPAKRFPPRKESLSQDTPILEPSLEAGSAASATGGAPGSDSATGAKPLPFIRPADIYKRMEEEREKERRSQESSRPSIDSNASRPRERDIFTSARQSQDSSRPRVDTASGIVRDTRSPALAPPSSSLSTEQLSVESKVLDGADDQDTSRKLKSKLDPVTERKSEYGFENMLKEASPDHPSSIAPATSGPLQGPSPLSASSTRSEQAEPLTAISASSNYSDRPDPVTASSQSSEKSLPHFLPVFRGVSDFGTDFLDRNSAQRGNLSTVRQPAFEAQDVQANPSTSSGASSLPLPQSQDAATTGADSSDLAGADMHHNPSVGLRSVVHQGFDESQDQVPHTPLSMSDSVMRSNSATASDISPIISRAPSSFPPGAGPHQNGSQHPSIAEEMENATSTSAPLDTTQPPVPQRTAHSPSEPALPPPPPPVKDGYRRDYSVPSPGNSQARTPLKVGTAGVPEAEVAAKSSATPTDSRRPWGPLQTTPQDPLDRKNQNTAIQTEAALRDPPLPAPPSTSSAPAGPPTRGTVREIAEKLENRTGRASPAISLDQDPETPRPGNSRLDSFRPSLPGGWQSYSTNAEVPVPQQDEGVIGHGMEKAVHPTHSQGDRAEDSPISSEDDDIPTAGPPKPRRQESDYGPSKTAFAAAAAAGSALVGAFTSATGLDTKHEEDPKSYEVSEDESTTKPGARNNISTRDFRNVTSKDRSRPLSPDQDEEPLAPSPPAKDTPSEVDTPASTLGYFPPPLKTSKVVETHSPATNEVSSPTRPPMFPALSSETSGQDTENDRLRKEIVRSLTPKSTRYEGESARPFYDDAPLPQLPVANQAHSSYLDNDDLTEPEDRNAQSQASESNQIHPSLSRTAAVPAITDQASRPPNNVTQARIVTDTEDHPVLEHRFSWEAQPETGTSSPSLSAALASASSPRAAQANQAQSNTPETIRPHSKPNSPSATTSSRTIHPLTPAETLRHVHDDGDAAFGEFSPRPNTPPQSIPIEPTSKAGQTDLRATDSNSLLQSSARETPFRDILSLGQPQDRIQAFNTNRAVVASQDTGLEEWLRAMGSRESEHSDILRNNGRLSAQENEDLNAFKPLPARTKFQRLASIANTNQSTDPEYDPSISNSPSGGRANNLPISGQGKKLLKDAGKIGGQAGVVAKGLFAKGKNKLRASGGGSDKGILAGRRRSSQPMIVIDEPQHSSVTTNTPPQIPNLNISPIESEDQWYGPIDAASSPLLERSISPINAVPRQEINNRDLMLPGHVDRSVQQVRQSSPRVSAVGSFHDGEVPSRSISEVTRPTNSGDERSPIAPIPEDFSPSKVTENIAVGGSKEPRLVTAVPTLGIGLGTAPIRMPSAPVSEALGPLPALSKTANASTNPAVTDPNFAEQDDSPVQDSTPKAQDQDRGALALASEALAAPQSSRHSAHSAVSSQGPRLPSERAQITMPDTNLPLTNERTLQSGDEPSNMPKSVSEPPTDAATPPYVEPEISKEAEAALYRAQEDSSREGLPAYDVNDEDLHSPRESRIGPGASIIPVADLSHRRQVSSGRTQSRPFSFVGGGTMILSGDQTPHEQLTTSSDNLSVQSDLAKEISVVSAESGRDSLDLAKRKSKSYSRPFVNDPNVRDHPAYRQSQDLARTKEIFVPNDQNENIESMNNGTKESTNDDGRYRIPGPYVQEYRSPKQQAQSLAAKQLPPAQANAYEQPLQRPVPGIDPLRSHDPRGEIKAIPSGPSVNGDTDVATRSVASPINDRPRQQSKTGLFRTRSKSRSLRSRTDEPQKVENKNEKRGGFFKQRPKGDGASVRSQLGSFRGESRDGLSDQMSRDSADQSAANGETADQVGDLNSTRPHAMLRNSGSGNLLQNDVRKKRFSGLGSLFGRSGAGGMKTSPKPQGPQPVQRASTLSHYLLGKPNPKLRQTPGASDTMYAQNQQRHQTYPEQDQFGNSLQSQPGTNVPIGGYYAPGEHQEDEKSSMPHDPDSFSRGRFSAEQQTGSDQHRNQQNQNGYQVPYRPGPQPPGQNLPSQISQQDENRPPLQINTNTDEYGVRRVPNHHFSTAPPGPAPQFPLSSQSSPEPPSQGSYHNNQRATSPYESRQGARSPYGYSSTQHPNQSPANHAIDLHKRSRSPRNGRRLSDDKALEEVNQNDPASQLGTFNKSAAPRSGGTDSEQEAPWKIGLPSSEEEENKRKSRATLLEREREPQQATLSATGIGNESTALVASRNEREPETIRPRKPEEEWRKQEKPPHGPTIAEKVMGVQLARTPLPLQRSTSAQNSMARPPMSSPVELPGSKAPGDDSDEEIIMSSTAYPGQEWAPENWGYGGNWDD